MNVPLKNSGYSTYWNSPASLYPDLFVHRMAEHMREFDLDGIQYGYHAELTNKNWMRGLHKTLNELNALAIPAGVSFRTIGFAPWTKRDYSHMAQPQHKLWAAFAWPFRGQPGLLTHERIRGGRSVRA